MGGPGPPDRDTPTLSFIIIGAQKSASTLLHRYLSAHPQVWMPPGEVPHLQDPHFQDRGPERLRALLAAAPPGRIVGIKRPDYLARSECPSRIRAYAPDARLLAVLRDPVDRAVSAYFHYMREGWVPIRPLDEGMDLLLSGAYADRYHRAWEILDFGRYFRHLSRYLTVFPRKQLLVVLHEELTNGDGYQTVQRFLGVTPRPAPLPSSQIANPTIYSLPRLRYRALVRPVTHRTVVRRTRTEPRTGLLARAALRFDGDVLSHVFPSRRPVPSERLGHRLAREYRDDVADLEKLLDRSLGHWLATNARS